MIQQHKQQYTFTLTLDNSTKFSLKGNKEIKSSSIKDTDPVSGAIEQSLSLIFIPIYRHVNR